MWKTLESKPPYKLVEVDTDAVPVFYAVDYSTPDVGYFIFTSNDKQEALNEYRRLSGC